MAIKWAISTNKGGVLKTTTAVNLAGVLAKKHRVLIVDTDNQGNVALSFGKNPDSFEHTIYDVLINGYEAEKAVINVHRNVDVLPANDDMAFFEFDVVKKVTGSNTYMLLKNALQHIEDAYDYILFDTAPNLGLATGNVLAYADKVLIPFQPESYSMRSLIKIISAVGEFQKHHNPNLEIVGVVGTLVDSRTNLHTAILQQSRQFCEHQGIKFFDTVIPRSVRFAASVAFETLPATIVDPKDKTVANYFKLAKELIG